MILQPDSATPPGHTRAVVILGAITALKIAVFLALVGLGRVKPFVGDNAEKYFIPTAQRILAEGRFNGPDSRDDSKVPPGYPLLLALSFGASEQHGLVIATSGQMIADGIVALLLWYLGCAVCSRRAGLWSGVMWLLFPPALVVSTWITAETFFTAALVAGLAMLIISFQRENPLYASSAGMLLGIATLLRPTTIALPLFLIPLWFRRDLRRPYRNGVCFVMSAACIILAWTARNQIILHDRIPVAVSFGAGVLQGSHESSFTIKGKRRAYPEMVRSAARDGIVKPDTDKASQIDGYLLRVGLHNYETRYREQPWSFASFFLYKSVRLWYGTESGGVPQQLFLGVCSLIVLPFAAWQLWRWRIGAARTVTMVFGLTIIYFFLLHLAVVPQYRYVHPIFPLLILAAAARATEIALPSSDRALKGS
jgi:4-amino-4-deoxy-L-arabinose transferase-like glycosyltransferase